MKPKSKSLRVSEERKMALERAAIEISYKTGVSIKWTELANHLFDKWLNEAKKDLISSTDVKKIMRKE